MFKVSSGWWAVLCLAVVFSGCTTYDSYNPGSVLFERGTANATTLAQVDRKVSADKPVEFKRGFRDGCDSGHACANNPTYGFLKDESRYSSEAQYKLGWNEGYDNCVVYHTADHTYPLRLGYWDNLQFGFGPRVSLQIGH